MTSAQDNDELARLDPQKHPNDDVATQRAATAKERAHRKNRKRKERIKRNYSERPEPHGIKMGQLRRWMMNEQRKEDKGGITQEGFYALSAWSKEPAGGGRITLASDAEQGKDRFMADWEAALKEQGTSNELVDWWKREPSYQERTGKMNPGKEYWKLVRENGVLVAKSKGLGERGQDAEIAIVLDDCDDDGDGDGDGDGGGRVRKKVKGGGGFGNFDNW
ncbi:MAG: hypothetical protein Q9199_007258 [Rusavskia elegans]